MTDCLRWIRKLKCQAFATNLFFLKPTIIQRCRPMTYKRISINLRDYCWNSSFFRFASVIEFVNLKSIVFKWQIICKPIFNIQETTFFRSFLTAFFEPQTLFGGGTERSPGPFPGRSRVEPEKSVWGSKKAVKKDRKKVVSWIVARTLSIFHSFFQLIFSKSSFVIPR